MKDKVFKVDRFNFNKVFKEPCLKVAYPTDITYILKRTRAVDLLGAGVTTTIIQGLLEHFVFTTTSIYLKISAQEAKGILKIEINQESMFYLFVDIWLEDFTKN